MSAISMSRLTAEFSLYRQSQHYLMTRSVGSIGDSERTVEPQAGSPVPPCLNLALGGCYPAPDGSLLSICPCGSAGTCGPCFDLSVEGFNLGNKNICLCESVLSRCCPDPSRPICCGVCRPQPGGGSLCDGQCAHQIGDCQ